MAGLDFSVRESLFLIGRSEADPNMEADPDRPAADPDRPAAAQRPIRIGLRPVRGRSNFAGSALLPLRVKIIYLLLPLF